MSPADRRSFTRRGAIHRTFTFTITVRNSGLVYGRRAESTGGDAGFGRDQPTTGEDRNEEEAGLAERSLPVREHGRGEGPRGHPEGEKSHRSDRGQRGESREGKGASCYRQGGVVD